MAVVEAGEGVCVLARPCFGSVRVGPGLRCCQTLLKSEFAALETEDFGQKEPESMFYDGGLSKPLLEVGGSYAASLGRPAEPSSTWSWWDLVKCWDISHNTSRLFAVTGRSGEFRTSLRSEIVPLVDLCHAELSLS